MAQVTITFQEYNSSKEQTLTMDRLVYNSVEQSMQNSIAEGSSIVERLSARLAEQQAMISKILCCLTAKGITEPPELESILGINVVAIKIEEE